MFLTLLAAVLAVSLSVSLVLAWVFSRSVRRILERIFGTGDGLDVARGWAAYLRFALVVIGVGGGVRIHQLERYLDPLVQPKQGPGSIPLELTADRWALELYRAAIETAQSVAWLLLIFFIAAMLAYVVLRVFEYRRQPKDNG